MSEACQVDSSVVTAVFTKPPLRTVWHSRWSSLASVQTHRRALALAFDRCAPIMLGPSTLNVNSLWLLPSTCDWSRPTLTKRIDRSGAVGVICVGDGDGLGLGVASGV